MVFADRQIRRMKMYLEQERKAFKPYLWVDTAFKRKSQPLFALAALEHERYVQFPKGFWRHTPEKQLSLAQCRVREHIYETGGDIGIWGTVKRYQFYYKKDKAYLLACNGEVIGKDTTPVNSQSRPSRELALITKAGSQQ